MQLIKNAIIGYLDENHNGWTASCIEESDCVAVYQVGLDLHQLSTYDWIAIDMMGRTAYMDGLSEPFNYENILQVITNFINWRESTANNARRDIDG